MLTLRRFFLVFKNQERKKRRRNTYSLNWQNKKTKEQWLVIRKKEQKNFFVNRKTPTFEKKKNSPGIFLKAKFIFGKKV